MSNVRAALGALLMAGALAGAQAAPPARSAAKPAQKQAKAAPAAVSLPAGAVETEPGTYRYTDAQEKKWIYRQTPFGLVRAEQSDQSPYTSTTASDAEGNRWVYRVTPFGIARFEQPSAAQAAQERQKVVDLMTATEDGDFIQFTRSGPFGTYKWKQKKTELNEVEQAAWQRELAKSRAGKE